MGETTVSLAGSTGSIGTQALEVIEASEGRFKAVALSAGRAIDALAAQAERLRPELVAIEDPALVDRLAALVPEGTEVMAGRAGLEAVATAAQVVVNGIVGFNGLPVTLAALRAGRRLALANKESLIAGAPVVQEARQTPGAELVPVDSEHCALHQCLSALRGEDKERLAQVARLVVTASGGPFRGLDRPALSNVSVDEALRHPTWAMGPKITVDSSTLMNKGLEVIEAHELFGVDYDRIEVLVHPQSIVHSMVELVDGSTLAQLSRPDMRLPLGYAMGWPERLSRPFGAMDWSAGVDLHFEPPDTEVFSCLELAYRAGRRGGGAPAWLNAANEVAVAAFLDGRLPWLGIEEVVRETLERWPDDPVTSVEEVLGTDASARAVAEDLVAARSWRAS